MNSISTSALGQCFHGHGAPGRERFGEERCIYGVHRREIAHIGQEDRRFHDIGQFQAGRPQDGLRVQERLARLLGDTPLRECPGGRVDGQLPRNEDKTGAAVHGLAVRPDGRRCLYCADRFHNQIFIYTFPPP